ncbi:hypothetical protein [uncultured Thiohalocapsa sp.]|uniref:hypothetical protein n=1 Tax=uncultured Thiohalocapsa sp. TaxID=768990 RepID=UPI0025F9FCF8|nr:hypothetical protein [uncultured Thiohalocapsa sp.]
MPVVGCERPRDRLICAGLLWELRHELEQALGRPLDLHTQDDAPVFVTKAIDRGEPIYAQDT